MVCVGFGLQLSWWELPKMYKMWYISPEEGGVAQEWLWASLMWYFARQAENPSKNRFWKT